MNTYLKFDELTQLEAEGITSMPNAEQNQPLRLGTAAFSVEF